MLPAGGVFRRIGRHIPRSAPQAATSRKKNCAGTLADLCRSRRASVPQWDQRPRPGGVDQRVDVERLILVLCQGIVGVALPRLPIALPEHDGAHSTRLGCVRPDDDCGNGPSVSLSRIASQAESRCSFCRASIWSPPSGAGCLSLACTCFWRVGCRPARNLVSSGRAVSPPEPTTKCRLPSSQPTIEHYRRLNEHVHSDRSILSSTTCRPSSSLATTTTAMTAGSAANGQNSCER
jgi:hypothetical protein